MPDLDGADHADDVYRVIEGKMSHRTASGERRQLVKGDEFHPTLKQVADGSLENKAAKVRDGDGGSSVTVGADIGLRSLPFTGRALEVALEAGLSEDDFEGVEPAGANGDYLTGQVRDLIDARGEENGASGEGG